MEQEEKRLLEIMDEQKAKIAELEAKLREALGSLSEMEAKYVVKDDEAGELDAELEVVKAKLADKEGVFTGFMDRINTMALVHGQLQQSDSGKTSMWMLATYIANQYGFAKKGVDLSVDIRMDMMLNAKEAILCGWIINELVSNCFEHAFPDGVTTGEPPEVKVEMGLENTLYGCQGRRLGVVAKDNRATPIKLVVSDNGIGLPEDFQFEDSKSLGMTIIESLALQLDGEMGFVSGKSGYQGTKFTIRFEI